MKIANREFIFGKQTYIMGILNVTPDSFSDGGHFFSVNKALLQAEKMILEGADILDIGGESTRPGHEKISIEEEISRVVPVISAIKNVFPEIPISIDTYKSPVAKAAILAGADLLNDVWGFRADAEMAHLAAEYNLPCCLMHNRKNIPYDDFWMDFFDDLRESLAIAKMHGVKKENIILDPGIGFAKSYEENLIVIHYLEKIKKTFPGYPLLLATSRKSMIGKALGDVPTEKRLFGTVATTVLGITKGCDMVRVHDVKENKEAILMTDAIVRM